jgi:hypothetical protein
MDAFSSGLITTLNGLFGLVTALASPVVLAIVFTAGALAWLGLVELELLNRQGAKPRVGRH